MALHALFKYVCLRVRRILEMKKLSYFFNNNSFSIICSLWQQ